MTEDPNNLSCQYMQALSEVAIGQFYNGVKTATKVGIRDQHRDTTNIIRPNKKKNLRLGYPYPT